MEILDLRSVRFEIRTILQQNESDDGRPIFISQNEYVPNMFSILGGKLDNIYDVLDKIEEILK